MALTKKRVCDTLAKGMRDYGYPDVTSEMAEDILNAYVDGKRGEDLPHDIIGMFLESQLKELEDNGVDLKTMTRA